MKNRNHPQRFRNPYLNWSSPSFTIMAVISLFTRWPLPIQVILCCIAGLTIIANIVCALLPVISKILSNRTNRKIKEKDAETVRSQREESFSKNFSTLVKQSPNLSDSKVNALTDVLKEYYNLEGQPPASESMPLLDNISHLSSYENATTTSPPQLQVVQKNEKEKLYK